MRVFFTNLGCKLNQAELESLARRFRAAGHRVVGALEEADLHVVNSCTVTHLAARTSRKAVRRARRRNPRLRTVLTGCYASEAGGAAAELAEVDLLVPNTRKERLLELVHERFPGSAPTQPSSAAVSADDREEPPLELPFGPLAFGHHRALVKVEDGCNMRCSFCIIPFTRGRQHSRSLDDCIAEVRSLAAAGFQEVVITGVQISAYRDGAHRLADLVAALLERTEAPRLRLTSIAPWQLDPRLLELWSASPRLCRHLHMSLQSGSSETLAAMRRPYTAERYAAVLAAARAAIPGLAVTTDVIAGFPGESERQAEESLAFVEAQRFAKIHVFPYSARRGTHAAEMPGEVSHEAKRERVAALLAVAERAERAFRGRRLGSVAEVVWEGAHAGRWRGTSDDYLKVYADASGDPPATLARARLDALCDDGLIATPLAAEARPSRQPSLTALPARYGTRGFSGGAG